MLSLLVKERLNSWMRYLDETNQVLFYTPYYQAFAAEKNSFNARHKEYVLVIEPLDVLSGAFTRIVRQFEINEEYICGFRCETRPIMDDEFVAEMLLPDYAFENVRRRSAISEELKINISRRFNAPMVHDCIKYAKEVLCEDDRSPEFYQILGAPCFIRNISEIWQGGEEYLGMVEDAYLCNYIARHD